MHIDFHPDGSRLRTFGLLSALASLVAATRFTPALWIAAAAVFAIVAVAAPRILRPVWVAVSVVTFPIGWMLSRIILMAIFALVITPIAIAFRLAGRSPLNRRLDRKAASYWEAKPQPRGPESYLRPF